MNTKLTKQCHTCQATKHIQQFRRRFKWAHRIYPECNACFRAWLLGDLLGRRIAQALSQGLIHELDAQYFTAIVAAKHAKRLAAANKRRSRKVSQHHEKRRRTAKQTRMLG
ncbi:MAG: hypothetical protein ACO3SE_09685 [Sedimenticolaceae bacterium]